MGSGGYVGENDTLEIAAGDSVVIKKSVLAVLSEALKNRKRPGNIGAAITDKNGFLDPFHGRD